MPPEVRPLRSRGGARQAVLRDPVILVLLLIAFFSSISGKPLDGLLMLLVATGLAWDARTRSRRVPAAPAEGEPPGTLAPGPPELSPPEPGGSAVDAATSGTAAPGTAASGTAASGTAASGTAAPGIAASGTAASGTAASGTAASGAAASGTAAVPRRGVRLLAAVAVLAAGVGYAAIAGSIQPVLLARDGRRGQRRHPGGTGRLAAAAAPPAG